MCQFKKTEFNKFLLESFMPEFSARNTLHLQKYCVKCDFEESIIFPICFQRNHMENGNKDSSSEALL